MDTDVLGQVLNVWNGAMHFYSTSVLVKAIKLFLFVYIVVLIADIVMIMLVRGAITDLRKTLYGTKRPIISKSKAAVRFEKILERLKSDNPSQYKVAVLEADAFAEEVLTGMGYAGATMVDKLETVRTGQIESKELLLEAHQIRNRIVHEIDFALSQEEAKKWIDAYNTFFLEVDLF